MSWRLFTGFNHESSSEKIQTSINTDQNNANEQSSIVPTTTTRSPTVQNEVYSSPTPTQGEELLAAPNSGTIIMTQILKSIIYGGLAGLIESLSTVTAEASTQVTTGKFIKIFSFFSFMILN